MDRQVTVGECVFAPTPRNRLMRGVQVAWMLALLVVAPGTLAGDDGQPRVREKVSYAGEETGPYRHFDLYRPAATDPPPPLMILIPGGFWQTPSGPFVPQPQTLQALTAAGLAVAVVHHRPAPAHGHPAQARDVAQATAFLLDHAGDYGCDPERVFLVGHSSGGHLAALVGLDPGYLGAHGRAPTDLAGVAALSGIFDLRPATVTHPNQEQLYRLAFGRGDRRRAASPVRHVTDDSPPFLALAGEHDLPGLAVQTRRFILALRRAGNRQAHYFLTNDNHESMLRLRPDQPNWVYLMAFLGVEKPPPGFAERRAARRHWHDPPASTEPFWRHRELIQTYPVDKRFVAHLRRVLEGNSYMLKAWPLERYYAIPLTAYLQARGPEIGSGPYLTTTNVRGERLYWRVDEIQRYEPVLVIGIDDERNLFRLAAFYKTRRDFSWQRPEGKRPLLVRPLAAFIFFRTPPPPRFQPQYLAQYSLTPDSFRLSEDDPLEPIADLPETLMPAFTHQNGCASCHAFRGIDARAHHNDADTLKPRGGFALRLTRYPPDVWQAFVFDQRNVAKTIGVSPNVVDSAIAKPLYELVVEERAGH